MRELKSLLLPFALIVASGCGGGGRVDQNKTGTTGPGSTTPPVGPFSVSEFTPRGGPASTPELTIKFAEAVDKASLVDGKTWLAAEDDDTNPGGSYHVMQGTLTVDAAGTSAAFKPTGSFTDGQEVRILLTSGVRSAKGAALNKGGASDPLSFTSFYPDQVFEGRFLPGSQPAPGPTPAPTPTPGGPPPSGSIPGPTFAPTTPPPGPSVAGAFEIVRTTPGNGRTTVPTSIFVEFSNPVDKTTLRGGNGATIGVFQATASPNSISFPQFGVRWANGDRTLEIVPQPLFTAGRDIFICFTGGLRDTSGKALTKGVRSGPLTKQNWIQGQIFELRFTPDPVPTPSIGGDPSIYQTEAGTDRWHIDFDARGQQLLSDMQRHGLYSGDAGTDALCKNRLMAGVLMFVSIKYGRTPDGKAQSGSWKISFSSRPSPGVVGRDYSRQPIGGLPPSGGTLGISNMDYGNRFKDDMLKPGEGVFAGVINGIDSKLDPFLKATDVKFLNGSYTFGSGGPADDARMLRVHAVIADWSHSLASVCSHECGHSVGLTHVDDRLSIMDSASTPSQLSEPRTYFYPTSSNVLDQNLGRQ